MLIHLSKCVNRAKCRFVLSFAIPQLHGVLAQVAGVRQVTPDGRGDDICLFDLVRRILRVGRADHLDCC